MIGITKGPDVMSGGAVAFLFGATGYLFVLSPPAQRLYEHLKLPGLYHHRGWKVWNYGVVLLVCVGGFIAIVVGAVMWATGTTAG